MSDYNRNPDFILELANSLLNAGAGAAQSFQNRALLNEQNQRQDQQIAQAREQQLQDQQTQRTQQLTDFATAQRLQQLGQLQAGLAYIDPKDPMYTQAQQAIAALEQQTGFTGQDAVNALFNTNVATQQYTPGQTTIASLPPELQAQGAIPTRTTTPGQVTTVNKSVNQILGDIQRNQVQAQYNREDFQKQQEQQYRIDYLLQEGLNAQDLQKLQQAWQTGERENSQVWQEKVLKINFGNDMQKAYFLNELAKDLSGYNANIQNQQDVETYWRNQFDTIGVDAQTGKYSSDSIIARYQALADSKDPTVPSYLKDAAKTAVDNGGYFPDAARTMVEQQIQSNLESLKAQKLDNRYNDGTLDTRIAQAEAQLDLTKTQIKLGDQQLDINALQMDYQSLVNTRYQLETYNFEVNSTQDYVKKAIDSGSYESINSLILAKSDPNAEGVTDAQRNAVANISLAELEKARELAIKVNNVNSYSYSVAYRQLQTQERNLAYGDITAKSQLIATVANSMTPEQIASIENDPVVRQLMADGRLNVNDIAAMKTLSTTRGLLETETINAPQIQRYSTLLTTTHLIPPDSNNPTAVANAEASLRGTLDKLVQLNAMDSASVEGIVSAYKNAWAQGNDEFAMKMALSTAQIGQINAAAALSRMQASGAGSSGGSSNPYGGLTPNQYMDGFNSMTDDMQTALNNKYRTCFTTSQGDALSIAAGAKTPSGVNCENYYVEQQNLDQTKLNFYSNFYPGFLPGTTSEEQFNQWVDYRYPEAYNYAKSTGATDEQAQEYATSTVEHEGQMIQAHLLQPGDTTGNFQYNPDLPSSTWNLPPIAPSYADPSTLNNQYTLPGVTRSQPSQGQGSQGQGVQPVQPQQPSNIQQNLNNFPFKTPDFGPVGQVFNDFGQGIVTAGQNLFNKLPK